MYEQGNREPCFEILVKLCDTFNCSIDDLIIGEENSKLEQILQLINGLNIKETTYLIEKLSNAKIQI